MVTPLSDSASAVFTTSDHELGHGHDDLGQLPYRSWRGITASAWKHSPLLSMSMLAGAMAVPAMREHIRKHIGGVHACHRSRHACLLGAMAKPTMRERIRKHMEGFMAATFLNENACWAHGCARHAA